MNVKASHIWDLVKFFGASIEPMDGRRWIHIRFDEDYLCGRHVAIIESRGLVFCAPTKSKLIHLVEEDQGELHIVWAGGRVRAAGWQTSGRAYIRPCGRCEFEIEDGKGGYRYWPCDEDHIRHHSIENPRTCPELIQQERSSS